MRWAALLQRVFEIDALRCPRCASTMRLIAASEDPAVARRILECLELPARAPPLGSGTAEPEEPERSEGDGFFDPAPTHEEASLTTRPARPDMGPQPARPAPRHAHHASSTAVSRPASGTELEIAPCGLPGELAITSIPTYRARTQLECPMAASARGARVGLYAVLSPHR